MRRTVQIRTFAVVAALGCAWLTYTQNQPAGLAIQQVDAMIAELGGLVR